MALLRVSIDLANSDPSLVRIERHSFVNLINVVHAELQLIERMAEVPGSLRSAIHLAEAASRAFKEARVARRHTSELADFAQLVESDVDESMKLAGELAEDEGVTEARSILHGVLGDAHLRVQEVLARHAIERPTKSFSADELREGAADSGLQLDADASTIDLPLGFERLFTLNQGVAGSEGSRIQVSDIRLTGLDSTLIDLCGTANEASLSRLGENMRAGELQKATEEAGAGLKVLMLAHYLSTPGEGLTIEWADGRFCASGQLSSTGAL